MNGVTFGKKIPVWTFVVSILPATMIMGCIPPEPPDLSGSGQADTADVSVSLCMDTNSSIATVDERFLSFSIDSAQLVGVPFWDEDLGPFDFSRPAIRNLAQQLSPAYFRVGGSDADKVFYQVGPQASMAMPVGYESVLTETLTDALYEFIDVTGLDLLFNLNGGPGDRDASKAWQTANASAFLDYTASMQYSTAAWALTNEPALFVGLHAGYILPASQLAADYGVLKTLIDSQSPGSLIAGIDQAYVPPFGEFLGPYLEPFLSQLPPTDVDAVTFHYYPQQSLRPPCNLIGWLAVPAKDATVLLNEERLDTIVPYLNEVIALRDTYQPSADVWLSESGNAQCGGEPGISDRFASSFWWLDQLGILAKQDVKIAVRQTLAGSDYGLVDNISLQPRSDYWASLLWKRSMGSKVLSVTTTTNHPARYYAHCHPNESDSFTLLVINIDNDESVGIDTSAWSGKSSSRYILTADQLDALEVKINGQVMRTDAEGNFSLSPVTSTLGDEVVVGTRSIAFIQIHEAGAAACD
jgi:heparanase 1